MPSTRIVVVWQVAPAARSIHDRLQHLQQQWQKNEISEQIREQRQQDMVMLQNRWKNGILRDDKDTDESKKPQNIQHKVRAVPFKIVWWGNFFWHPLPQMIFVNCAPSTIIWTLHILQVLIYILALQFYFLNYFNHFHALLCGIVPINRTAIRCRTFMIFIQNSL